LIKFTHGVSLSLKNILGVKGKMLVYQHKTIIIISSNIGG